jgi:hypothetical protein
MVFDISYAVARVWPHAAFGRAVLYLLWCLIFALHEGKNQTHIWKYHAAASEKQPTAYVVPLKS